MAAFNKGSVDPAVMGGPNAGQDLPRFLEGGNRNVNTTTIIM